MSATITTIIVTGAAGRMGSRICELASRDSTFKLIAALERQGSPAIGHDAFPARSPQDAVKIAAVGRMTADVVIDFSSDQGARTALELALNTSAALLVGTTALSPETVKLLREASKKISVLLAPNTSLGVAAVADAAARLAPALGPEYRCSIVESHHVHKKDAPSGTALRLARAVKDAGGVLPDDQIFAIRAGDIIGEHIIRFAGPGEVIELVHRATTRDVFVIGALRAARWLHGRGPGWWTIEDVLGFATTSPQDRE